MNGRQETPDPPLTLQNRYRLVERLGGGSMGIVYRAHDETLGRDVAVKFLMPDKIASSEASARFLREARAVARLSHSNIVTLYDVGREDEWHYLVLEHIPGQDLRKAMIEHGGPLSVHDALSAVCGTLEALAYAHAQDIVHRDIKPENIMVMPGGQVKVTDFGLALAQDDVRLTQDGMIVGTVLYLAPEVISGQPADLRSDLYAVGGVLYELLIGRPPFTSDDPLAIFSQILNTPPTPPRMLDASIPSEVEQVIVRLLAKDPDDRYASAHAVLSALPGQQEMADRVTEETEQIVAERASLSLLERIVRSSSTSHLKPATQDAPDETPLLTLPAGQETAPPDSAAELLVYAAQEDTSAAVEAEQRRLAGLLERRVVDPLNLLLSQANAYAQTLSANPAARMAISVLSSLTQQTLQGVRDLETNLHPAILETLGLEPALESLASQMTRAHGIQVALDIRRMRERLPPQIELALFRAAQDALDRAVDQAHASQVTVFLRRSDDALHFSLSDNGIAPGTSDRLRAVEGRIKQLGGTVEMGTGPYGEFELKIAFTLDAPVELTPREMETIQLLAEGLSNKEIARLLSISPRTVNFHLNNIYSKLGVNSRTEAAIYALRHGWMQSAH